jgi:DNA-binding response OmpR family regulator
MTKVLVVDDSEDIAMLVVQHLRLEGFEAEARTSGFDELLDPAGWRTPPDVVIVDLNLPGTDGGDILRFVQANFPATRRVLYSGSDPQWLPGGLELVGLADAVILKSANLAEIVEACRA